MHAARMVRYRAKLAQGSAGIAAGLPDEGGPREIVTHHGSPAPPTGDLVAAGATAVPRDDASPAEPPGRAMTQCHWCGRCCLLPLRRGFLRRCDHRRRLVGPPEGVQAAMVIATGVAVQRLSDVTAASGARSLPCVLGRPQ